MTPKEYWRALRGDTSKRKPQTENAAPQLHCISDEVYGELATQLVEKIGARNYVTAAVEAHTEQFYYKLTVDAVIYWHNIAAPDGNYREIEDIVPVWWELHSYEGDEGLERLNNATFDKIKERIIAL